MKRLLAGIAMIGFTVLVAVLVNKNSVVPAQAQMQVQPTPHAATRSLTPAAPQGEPRVALVIGNDRYPYAPLVSPVNDARAMQKTLTDLGFDVISLENASAIAMIAALREFSKRLGGEGGVGLFYFAGHGVQVEGENYLVPVETTIKSEADVKYQALHLNQVMDEMERARNRINVVILDACRDNPFARQAGATSGGLAPLTLSAPSGFLIAFATAPGQVALDGDDNGIFTKHLLSHLATPNQPIEQLFKRVRASVMDETRSAQIPWENSSLTDEFYFNPWPRLASTQDVAPWTPSAAAPAASATPAPALATVVTGAANLAPVKASADDTITVSAQELRTGASLRGAQPEQAPGAEINESLGLAQQIHTTVIDTYLEWARSYLERGDKAKAADMIAQAQANAANATEAQRQEIKRLEQAVGG